LEHRQAATAVAVARKSRRFTSGSDYLRPQSV
jgi:hypothetical protein